MFPWLWKTGIKGRHRKLIRVIFWSVSIIVILLFPWYYEPGGPFRLLPLERIEVHTQVEGEIKKVLVKENDRVKRGDVQALIDTRAHQKDLDVHRAELEKAKADLILLEKGPKPEEVKKAEQDVQAARTHLEYSREEEQRLRFLFNEGVIAEEEYMAASKRADVDAQNLEVAKANLELVESGFRLDAIEAQKAVVRDLETKVKYYAENVELTKLRAPISGKVVTPYMGMKVGQFLKKGDLFATYENHEVIQAEIQLYEADWPEVKIGGKIRVRPEAYPTRFFYGDIVFIAPDATQTPNGKVVRVLTNIPNPDQELKPDMTGEAKIEGSWKPVIIAFTRPIVRFIMVEVWSWFP